MRGFFVTGTDTEVGKTWVSVGLITVLAQQGQRVAAMKPVGAGCVVTDDGLRNDDALLLQRYANVDLAYDEINPYALLPPIAPHIAAASVGVQIDIEQVRALFDKMAQRSDCVIVEGAGGWFVPLSERQSMADMARALGLPVILVVGIRLGCINHALLSADAIGRSGLTLAGWVANRIDDQCLAANENIQAISARIDAPLLGVIPHLPDLDAGAVAQHLSIVLERCG